MNSIIEEKEHKFLARPLKQKQHHQLPGNNIFAPLRSTEPLPGLQKLRGKSYDFVGSQQFKQKYTQSQPLPAPPQPQQCEPTKNPNLNLTSSLMNSTINRNTILSKLTHQQTNMATKQQRQLHRYREYQEYWEKESKKIHKMTLRDRNDRTLLEDNVKGVYVHPNQDRMDIINNYVVNMWEMSLRNHNKILQRHIAGNKFGPVQLEELLQTDRGVKTVERSIPVLPLDKLKGAKKRELSLTGRNKALSETYRTGGASTGRVSLGQTPNQEEVYKISYTGNVKWMSTEGL